MTQDSEVLVVLVSLADAVWRPMRQPDWAAGAGGILYTTRRDFEERGVPWVAGGSQKAIRTADLRVLHRMATEGLVSIAPAQGRHAAVKLTDRGDSVARALADLPNVVETHALLRVILSLEATCRSDPCVTALGPLVYEPWLLDRGDYVQTDEFRTDLCELQRALLPSLVRGWIVSHSDIQGRVYYGVSSAGRAAASQPAPVLPADLPSADEEAASQYDAETTEYRESLRTLTPEGGDIGPVPLPCSLDLPRRRRAAQAETVGDG